MSRGTVRTIGKVRLVPLRIRRCGHTRNNLPFVIRVVQPCVDHAKATRLFRAALVDPRQANTIGDGDVVTGCLRREALQIIGFEKAIRRICESVQR